MERYQDLRRAGVTRAELAGRVRRGDLVRVRRGAFRKPGTLTPEEEHLELMAAMTGSLVKGAVVSHASAAVLHGLPVPRDVLGRVFVTTPGVGRVTRHLHRYDARVPEAGCVELGRLPEFGALSRLMVGEGTDLSGLPVTSLARTVVDLARSLAYHHAVAVVDAALRMGVGRDALEAELELARRRPGNARARMAVEFGDGRAESPGESWSRVQMAALGLPKPGLQTELFDVDGKLVARVDFDWEEYGVVGEFDGDTKYGRLLKPGQDVNTVVRKERAREERIRRQDRWVIRWVTKELFNEKLFRQIIETGLKNGLRRR
ncbi:hypothetical protein AADG42_03645 [Ammonicoccus fulvus]|uniref:Transcriptional regulator, AbiEi antitoxin, Type IV TA system n=1 Tax=Ammonicoccus fulvus TaxID=3138240 RepID=A0ABZ3FNU8_9ACTN